MHDPASTNGVPHHADVHSEKKDVDTNPILYFVAGLILSILVAMAGLWGLVHLLNANARATANKAGTLPLAEQERSAFREQKQSQVSQPLPEDRLNRWRDSNESTGSVPNSGLAPLPRPEGFDIQNPEHTVGRLYESTAVEQRRAQEQWLNSAGSYDVVIKPRGKAAYTERRERMPIEDAMKRVAGKLPHRDMAVPEEEWLQAPTRASSGRQPASGAGGAP